MHGTSVPVEEPSTASEPDSCTATRLTGSRLASLDHLVGAQEEGFRDFETECLGGSEIDDKGEPRRDFDRQIGGLDALEDCAERFVHELFH
jgi:hypothetical protein